MDSGSSGHADEERPSMEIQKLSKSRSGYLSHYRRVTNNVLEWIKELSSPISCEMKVLLGQKRDELSTAFMKFESAHVKLLRCSTDSDKDELKFTFDSLVEQRNRNLSQIDVLMQNAELTVSVKSKSSSTLSKSSKSERRRAIALLELENLKEKQELERQEDELRRKRELLDAEMRLAKVEIEGESDDYASDPTEISSTASKLKPLCESLPSGLPTSSKNKEVECWSQQSTYHLMTQALNEGFSLPKVELTMFSGNPIDYVSFIRSFETNIESRTNDPGKLLSYLIQFCSGEAKKSIECCRLLEPHKGLTEAKRILKNRYGQPFIIAHSVMNQVISGPELKPSDQKALFDLASELESCSLTLHELGYTSELNASYNLRRIVGRLPKFMKARWIDRAGKIRDEGREPLFDELFLFIQERARYAIDPIYGGTTVDTNVKRPMHLCSNKSGNSKSSTLFATQSSVTTDTRPVTCADCFERHYIKNCEIFKKRSLKDRMKVAQRKGLCFNCLVPRHTSSECRKEKLCDVLGCKDPRKHNSLLHRVDQNDAKDSEVHLSKDVQNRTQLSMNANTHIYFNVVPVRLSVPHSSSSVVTYAILDSASDVSVCTENLLSLLGIEGVQDNLIVSTISSQERLKGKRISLNAQSLSGDTCLTLAEVWSLPKFNLKVKQIPKTEDFQRWPHLQGISATIPDLLEDDITLLIGADHPEAHIVKAYRQGKDGEPIGILGIFGWSLFGPSSVLSRNQNLEAKECTVNFVSGRDCLRDQVERFWSLEAVGLRYNEAKELSIDDRRALTQMESSVKLLSDQHYEMRLPWRDETTVLQSNRSLAMKRLTHLSRRLSKDDQMFRKYSDTIHDYLDKGFAVEVDEATVVPKTTDSRPIWYIPHHGVVHPQKPDKVRVVFDCSAEYKGISLNSQLLSGPDLTNSLVCVLLRFRREKIAIVGDIEAMFHQVRVHPIDWDALRFLWWPNDDMTKEPKDYQMTVHLFGATSSPSCANFALRKTAVDNQGEFSQVATESVLKNFYVDDFLKSVENSDEGLSLVMELCSLLRLGGFKISKWSSNSVEILKSIPEENRSKAVFNLDLGSSSLPVERTLGVQWDAQTDCFQFLVNIYEKPATRRGILSIISSVYDPLGLIAPVILPAKLILQELCKEGLSWDQSVDSSILLAWKRCQDEILKLSLLSVSRCLKPANFGRVKHSELHIFSDASEKAYGCVAYIRQISESDDIHVSLLIAKSRLCPLKTQSIPRLELQAALVATRLYQVITDQADFKLETTFWSDSTSVILYLQNTSKRYKTFVANRLAEILSITDISQWKFVPSSLNPADIASRGATVEELQASSWFHGPQFLMLDKTQWPRKPDMLHANNIASDDVEIKKERTVALAIHQRSSIDRFIETFSSWNKLVRCMSWILKFREWLINKVSKTNDKTTQTKKLSASDLHDSEISILCYVQKQHNWRIGRRDTLRKLDPIVINNLICVGGRLRNSDLCEDSKHQIILPKKHVVTDLLIRKIHEENGHIGANHVLVLLRERFWPIQGKSAIKRVLNTCFVCRRWKVKNCSQKMADLPASRVTSLSKPFEDCGVDFFGPFHVKYRRGTIKRYGCIFTCFRTRAIHLEMSYSLETDSFITSFQRFTNRRGLPAKMHSDNGTNFVGASKRLEKQGIIWEFNPPCAPHTGGVWERLIRDVKRILQILIDGQLLTDDSLQTFFTDVERILNSRPITTLSDDPRDPSALTPNHFLIIGKPYNTARDDMNLSEQWHHVQNISTRFWRRWQKEYLHLLQERTKWKMKERNLKIGDLVLISDNQLPRGSWPMGIVEKVLPSPDGLVRQVQIRTTKGTFTRAVTSVCLLEGDLELK